MISIVIPIHNEEKYLKNYLFDLSSKLKKSHLNYEIVLSENGSQDQTLKIAKSLSKKDPKIKVLTSRIPNYGLAVKMGFLFSKADYLVLFDLDYYDVDFLQKSLPFLKKVDVIVGAKIGVGSKDNRILFRKLVTLIFSLILKLFFGLKISDTHGIKILKRKSVLPIIKECRFTKDIFDTELLIRSQYRGLKLAELPIIVNEKRSSRTSIIKRSLRTIKDLIILKIHLAREYPHISVK